ncbi:hypothetical protein [Arthrobacter sp. BE255]|uniref:hypothetical protein n=1 Tax=Arthrobacter sp. BE255 TaxID=2817721 RepID=UPI0028667F9B|nr:hypothetical protein [Arthrobacter sp. BE255]MDR7159909.1 hypothetical protein [Arthrobacter sp. BE255]
MAAFVWLGSGTAAECLFVFVTESLPDGSLCTKMLYQTDTLGSAVRSGCWKRASGALSSSELMQMIRRIKVREMKARQTYKTHRKHAALSDWRELRCGELVNILMNAQIIARGQVEEVSGSGRVLWIMDERSKTQAFLRSDGVFVQRY